VPLAQTDIYSIINKKTHGFKSSSGFAVMSAGVEPFFPPRVYPNLIHLFLTYFLQI
jgi:hypothetical protein